MRKRTDMKVKDFFKLFFIYVLLVLIGSIGYVLSFKTPIFASMDVFFYRGISIIILWGALMAVVMLVLRAAKFKKLITIRDVLLLFAGFCCVHVVIFTHLPVTADRSITVFMLGYMSDNADKSYTVDEMEDYFVERYVGDYGAFEKRFHEQLVTGTIEDTGDGSCRITESGIKLMKIYEVTAELYGLDDKLIHPDGTEEE